MPSFIELGLNSELLKACSQLQWEVPTPIQELAIPHALQGRNIVGLAETGSGKTGAYILPILHKLIENPYAYYCLVLAPTRELAAQVHAQFVAFGKAIGLSTILLVGGIPITQQADQMRVSPPHILIATPGRLLDHVKKTKGFDEFTFARLQFLVIDEADRMLGSDFDSVLEKILCLLPSQRQTFLFSATMTNKVGKLQRTSIRDPVRISTRKSKFQAVACLRQYVQLVPQSEVDAYLVHLLRVALCPEIEAPGLDAIRLDPTAAENTLTSSSVIVFTRTRVASNRLNLLLRQFLRQPVIALNGDMPQAQRLGALQKFKRTQGAVLVATDVASRGLDIPQVGLVINYDVPLEAKTYMHRVGRTARAGRFGCALTLLTQYSVVFFLKEIEAHLLSSAGEAEQHMPSLVEPGSPADKELEAVIANLNEDVKEAVARSNQAMEGMRKRFKSSGTGKSTVFTAVDDMPAPSSDQVPLKAGMKRTAWASEAPKSKRAEIAEVIKSISFPTPSASSLEIAAMISNRNVRSKRGRKSERSDNTNKQKTKIKVSRKPKNRTH